MAYPKAWIEETRQAILDDPFFLAGILGIEIQWFHRTWYAFCKNNPKHLLEAARGAGKSTVCTTLLVIHEILRNPNIRVLLISRTEGMASRMLQEIRGFLESNQVLIACFGAFVGLGKWTDTELVVAQRTSVHKESTVSAMGLEGQITSGHWELEIFDDPFDEGSSRSRLARDRAFEWLFTTLKPTLMDGGTMGGRCTRYHYDDLAGRIERDLATDTTTGECHVYRLEAKDQILPIPRDAAWKVLQSPVILADGSSIWERRFPLKDRVNENGSITEGLERKRREGGAGAERRFCEQYLMICTEVQTGEKETVFKRLWVVAWKKEPDRKTLAVFQFVDPAFKDRDEAARRTKRDRDPDFYAIGVLGFNRAAGRVYVLDAFRDRLTPLERERRTKDVADEWKPNLIKIERSGLQVREAPDYYLRIRAALLPHRAVFVNPDRAGKVSHAEPFARAMEGGIVEWSPQLLEKYPGLVDEFCDFPFGLHDDFVDAISGAFLVGSRDRPHDLSRCADQTRPDYASRAAPGHEQRAVPRGAPANGAAGLAGGRAVGGKYGGTYSGGDAGRRAVPR